MKKLFITGVGMGSEMLLSPYAEIVIKYNTNIYMTKGMEGRFDFGCKVLSLSEIYEMLETQNENIVLLVSGDAGFYSLSGTLISKFGDQYDIEIINGFNSLQYFCGKLKRSYENMKTVSMHGRDGNIVSHVSYHKEVFVLTGGEFRVQNICDLLCEKGLTDLTVYVGENLSCENEKIYTGTPEEFRDYDFDSLAVMIIENPRPCNRFYAIKDDEFIRDKVPMTKFEIRSVVLSELNIQPTDVVFDIGSGTGSVTVEMAKKAFEGKVCAFEKNPDAVALLTENIHKFGTYNIDIFQGDAKSTISAAPKPNKVFIGGSSGDMQEILDLVESMNPQAEIVFTANTLQAISQITSLDITITNVSQISSARNKKAGAFDLMIAQNPVYIVSAQFRSR